MKLIKRLLLLLLVATGASAAGYVYLNKNHPDIVLGSEVQKVIDEKLPLVGQVLGTFQEQPPLSLEKTLDLTTTQLETLKEKSLEVKDQLDTAISEIKTSSQSTPLHEKAFEYGQYVYCQQVVKEYEAN